MCLGICSLIILWEEGEKTKYHKDSFSTMFFNVG